MADHKTLRLGRSGKVALVDADDHARLSRFSWTAAGGGHVRRKSPRRRGSKSYSSARLTHEILDLPPHVRVRHINGDRLDCRRANLQPVYGSINEDKRRQLSAPYRVSVCIDYRAYNAGSYPTQQAAERIAHIAGTVGAQLRGRGLTRNQIQLRLDAATGRAQRWHTDGGAQLAKMIRESLPANLSPDVRDEAEQEIALAIMDGKIGPDEVGKPDVLRRFLRAAGKLAHFDGYRHVSLDHQIGDGVKLIDVLAA